MDKTGKQLCPMELRFRGRGQKTKQSEQSTFLERDKAGNEKGEFTSLLMTNMEFLKRRRQCLSGMVTSWVRSEGGEGTSILEPLQDALPPKPCAQSSWNRGERKNLGCLVDDTAPRTMDGPCEE